VRRRLPDALELHVERARHQPPVRTAILRHAQLELVTAGPFTETNSDIEVAEAAWEFFKDKRAKPVANVILEPALSPERTRAPENAHRAESSSAPNTPSAHPSHAA
jgi:hypothetical protein